VITLVDFKNFDFAESLKKSLEECISHEKGEVLLKETKLTLNKKQPKSKK